MPWGQAGLRTAARPPRTHNEPVYISPACNYHSAARNGKPASGCRVASFLSLFFALLLLTPAQLM